MQQIRNGSQYPAVVKAAALEEYRVGGKSMHKIAVERNFSSNTMQRWAVADGQHTVTPNKNTRAKAKKAARATKAAARAAKLAAITAADTPAVQPDGTITYKGKVYTSRF